MFVFKMMFILAFVLVATADILGVPQISCSSSGNPSVCDIEPFIDGMTSVIANGASLIVLATPAAAPGSIVAATTTKHSTTVGITTSTSSTITPEPTFTAFCFGVYEIDDCQGQYEKRCRDYSCYSNDDGIVYGDGTTSVASLDFFCLDNCQCTCNYSRQARAFTTFETSVFPSSATTISTTTTSSPGSATSSSAPSSTYSTSQPATTTGGSWEIDCGNQYQCSLCYCNSQGVVTCHGNLSGCDVCKCSWSGPTYAPF